LILIRTMDFFANTVVMFLRPIKTCMTTKRNSLTKLNVSTRVAYGMVPKYDLWMHFAV
jgi:hypothetical protein